MKINSKGRSGTDGEDILGYGKNFKNRAFRYSLEKLHGVGKLIHPGVKAWPQSGARINVGSIDIRDHGPINPGLCIILPAQRLDQAVRYRLVGLSLKQNRISQETLVVSSESSIHRDRPTHAVHPLL